MPKNNSTYSNRLFIVWVIIAVLFILCIIGCLMQALSAKYASEDSPSDDARVAKFDVSASEPSKSDLSISQSQRSDETIIIVKNQETEAATEYYVEIEFPEGADLPNDVEMLMSYIDSEGVTKTAECEKKDDKYIFTSNDWKFQPSSSGEEKDNIKNLSLNFSLKNGNANINLDSANESINNIKICVYCYQID